MTRIKRASHFAWQAQHYLVRLGGGIYVNDVSYLARINHDVSHFAWQGQYLAKVGG